MNSQERAFTEFAQFAAKLKGDEKNEAQTFLFHLLEAFSHDANTLPEGCTVEYRVRVPGERTKFADLVWPSRVLIEMKQRGYPLEKAYDQLFEYWQLIVPNRPAFAILCNFDAFWIYYLARPDLLTIVRVLHSKRDGGAILAGQELEEP